MSLWKIKLPRGKKENLPSLSLGEPAYITDEGELYIGGINGENINITNNATLKDNTQELIVLKNKETDKINYAQFGLSSAIAIDSSTTTNTVILNTINKANIDLFELNNGVITIKKEGIYIVEALISYFPNASGYRRSKVYYNDVSYATVTEQGCDGGSDHFITTTLNCSANSQVWISATQNSGSALNIGNGSFIRIRKIG